MFRSFPGDSVVENPTANAGDTGSIPGPGLPHMSQSNQTHVPQLLSLCSRAWELGSTEPEDPRVRAPQQATTMRNPHTLTMEQSPLAITRGKPMHQQRPSTTKTKQINLQRKRKKTSTMGFKTNEEVKYSINTKGRNRYME